MNESFTPPTEEERSHFIECPLPYGWPFRDYTPEQKGAGRKNLEEAGARWAADREQRILDAILKEPQAVRIMPNTWVRYFLAAENIEAGKWCCLADNGTVRVANDQAGLSKAAELGTYTVGADASIQERYEKATGLIHDARMAAGCKPGESLIERCHRLAALEAGFTAPILLWDPTPEETARLREHAGGYRPISFGPIEIAELTEPSGARRGCDMRPGHASMRGTREAPEEMTAQVVYEATLQHAEGLTEEDAVKFLGRPVIDETRTKVIGRIAKAARKGNFIVGTIEFEPGKEPHGDRRVLSEPKPESWRDRPALL